jgi:phage-related protein
MWKVELLRLANGRCPAYEFLLSCSPDDRSRIFQKFSQIEAHGPNLGKDYVKHIQGEIYELRFHIMAGAVRFLFFYESNHIMIITNGFQKKTEKTSASEIELAFKYYRDYLSQRKS